MRNTHISYHYYALELFFCGAHIEITNRSQQIILAARERETEGKLKQSTDTRLTLAQQFLSDRWDEHVRGEFATKDAAAALDTMVPDACVNHVQFLTGGMGRDQLKEFYFTGIKPLCWCSSDLLTLPRFPSLAQKRQGS